MRPLLLLLCLLALSAAHPKLSFTPLAPHHAGGSEQYRAIWEQEGPRIVAALEAASGLAFPAGEIDVIVSDSPPMTAYDGRTMRLRARYSPAYKRATLVHEMGHRLSFLLPRAAERDDHRLLYLFLYDAWNDLYGPAFADRMVSIERRIGPSYAAAWDWALAMTREERQARLRALQVRLEYERLDLG